MPNIRRGMMGAAGVSAEPATQFSIYSWGANNDGSLGDGTTTSRCSPVQMGDKGDWVQVSTMTRAGGAAINAAGELWTWGLNGDGQLGLGDTTSRSSPTQVGSLTTWAVVSAGRTHFLAVKKDGTLWAAGLNSKGELGDDSTTNRSSPVQIGSLTDWPKTANLLAADYSCSHAIKTDGTLWSWGGQADGALGNGENADIYISSPIQIGSDTDWESIRSGGNASLCIRNGDEYWCWGSTSSLGTGEAQSSPVQVAGSWLHVCTGDNNTSLGIKTGGTLWGWGNGWYGSHMLGNQTTVYSPTQVGSLTDWNLIAASHGNMTAIKTDSTLWIAGSDEQGKLGRGTSDPSRFNGVCSPIQIGSTEWLGMGGGGDRSLSATRETT